MIAVKESVDAFLDEAAHVSGASPAHILAAVLHLDLDDDERFAALLPDTDNGVKALFCQLDRALRLRNPGLHYVERKMYLAYRREHAPESGAGERSQIFLSVIRTSSALEVVLPLDPADYAGPAFVRSLTGKGHHGIGDLGCRLSSADDVDLFIRHFGFWLNPSA